MTPYFQLIVLLFVFCIPAQCFAESRPNVLLILADDLGYECIGANGCKSYKTPHLDQLAQGGARFNHCYAQPLCTPTRVQLMTGIYNVRNYVEFGTLIKSARTFGHSFKEAGYKTMIAGKWQLGKGFELPAHFGFDEYLLWQLNQRPSRYRNPTLESNGNTYEYTHNEFGPDLVNDFVTEYIGRSHDKPWLVYYPLMLTHEPFVATPNDSNYALPAKRKNDEGYEGLNADKQRHFKQFVEYMDMLLGKVINKLKDTKQFENTLILFVGDNGTLSDIKTETEQGLIKGGKGSPTNAGTRVPLIVSWPNKISKGQVRDELVDTTDFLPTMCAAAGINIPENIDGRNFLPLLKGEPYTPRDWVYCWYHRGGGPKAAHEFARNQQYKLYTNGNFFDITADSLEKSPLPLDKLNTDQQQAFKQLEITLKSYANARPVEIYQKK